MPYRILLGGLVGCLVLAGCEGNSESTPAAPASVARTPDPEAQDPRRAGDAGADAASRAAQAPAPVEVAERRMRAGCALCIFEMDDAGTCAIAVEIDGEHYLVEGISIDEHGDAHAADGLCNTARDALASGTIRDGKFVATSLELLPTGG